MPSSAGSVFKHQEEMTMYRNILITTTFMSFTLFATPSMSSAESQPVQADVESQSVEVARDAGAKKIDSQILTSKKAQYEATGESVDCFYEANKANPDCSGAKPDQR
jgi:hypothetical protein